MAQPPVPSKPIVQQSIFWPARCGLGPPVAASICCLPSRPAPTQQDPWFQAGLPSNALAMNKHYLSVTPVRQQSAAGVRAVVDELQHSDSDDDSLDLLLLD